MASLQQKLAASLNALEILQERGVVAVRSYDLSRTHRERLLAQGCLQQVMKGWYVDSRLNLTPAESTAWYASFWEFCADYLTRRFGQEWSLSPEQSVVIHAGNRSVPTRLAARSPGARNRITALAHDTSIFETRASLPPPEQTEVVDGLRLFSVAAALVASGPALFTRHTSDVRTVLATMRDVSGLLPLLLAGGRSTVAGRLAGALRNIGRDSDADTILATMKDAGYDVRESDPFDQPSPLTLDKPAPLALDRHDLPSHVVRLRLDREDLPANVVRLRLDWHTMRERVIATFPDPPDLPRSANVLLRSLDEVQVEDARHSLALEGVRVEPEFIERLRDGEWPPDAAATDREHGAALATMGYNAAFELVRESVARVVQSSDPGKVAANDHADWYRELVGPSVSAGFLNAADVSGYRDGPIVIRHSRRMPPAGEAMQYLMPALFDLLGEESHPGVRAVLGHFIFAHIHPYTYGNGRMGRFLMNVTLVAGGYPWIIVPAERRDEYMASLETASIEQDIGPFAEFLAELVRHSMTRPA